MGEKLGAGVGVRLGTGVGEGVGVRSMRGGAVHLVMLKKVGGKGARSGS